jgi:DNA-binding MarR family transcriptional regulator
MTRSRDHTTGNAPSAGLSEAKAVKTNAQIAAEAWQIVSDMVLDNERRQRVADTLGLSFGRARALRRIAKGPKSMGELADVLGIDPPYLTLVVDDLERQGLVERRPHPSDRRRKLVVATRRGEDAAQRAQAILGTPPDRLAALNRKDLTELVRILRQVAAPTEH